MFWTWFIMIQAWYCRINEPSTSRGQKSKMPFPRQDPPPSFFIEHYVASAMGWSRMIWIDLRFHWFSYTVDVHMFFYGMHTVHRGSFLFSSNSASNTYRKCFSIRSNMLQLQDSKWTSALCPRTWRWSHLPSVNDLHDLLNHFSITVTWRTCLVPCVSSWFQHVLVSNLSVDWFEQQALRFDAASAMLYLSTPQERRGSCCV